MYFAQNQKLLFDLNLNIPLHIAVRHRLSVFIFYLSTLEIHFYICHQFSLLHSPLLLKYNSIDTLFPSGTKSNQLEVGQNTSDKRNSFKLHTAFSYKSFISALHVLVKFSYGMRYLHQVGQEEENSLSLYAQFLKT